MSRHSVFSLAIVCALVAPLYAACDAGAPTPAAAPAVRAAALAGDPDTPIAMTAPATETASLAANTSLHYRLTVPPTHEGLRLALSCTANADLIVRRDAVTNSARDARYNGPLHTLFYTPADTQADDAWYLEVHADADADCALRADPVYARALTWDDGATADGTAVTAAPDDVGGDYLFTMTTELSAWGAWRTLLPVTSGEADLYMQQGSFPTYGTYKAEAAGSDAVVLHRNDFADNQLWYLRVHATPGSAWSLVSGDLHVVDLGPLADDASSGGTVTIGLEGAAWVRASVPADTLAWRLAAPGATLYVDDEGAPVPSRNRWDQTQPDAALLVPPYLTTGQYIVAVGGPDVTPGQEIAVDSRKQAVRVPTAEPGATGDTFAFTLPGADDGGYPWLTYAIDVPVDQIAWQAAVTPSGGEADVYVRKGAVPNATNNDGFSEAGGAVTDTVTQVPPELTNGTWYVSVRCQPGATFTLTSGNPTITDIPFINDPTPVVNDAAHADRVGWRFFRVPDIDSQVGTLGWILEVEGAPADTEIAVRRNAVPNRWRYRQNDYPNAYDGSRVDYSSTTGFLERPNHPADIWYVGVYNPSAPLGTFALRTRRILPETLEVNGGAAPVTDQASGRWRYFKVIVPPGAIGWDVALDPVTAGAPRMVIRRDQLPDAFSNSPSYLYQADQWDSGWRWAIGTDLTHRTYGVYVQGQTATNESGRRFFAGMGSPLSEGTYYVGVSDLWSSNNDAPMSYTLTSRGVGQGDATAGDPWDIQITDLPWDGGSVTRTGRPARGVDFFKVEVPADAPSWALRLAADDGEAMMAVREGALPNINAGSYDSDYSGDHSGTRRQKVGNELFYKYPGYNETALAGGTYYVAVASEGQAPYSTSYIGTGTSSWTLTSQGSVTMNGGAATTLTADAPLTWSAQTLEYGAQQAYRFTVPDGISSMEIRLTASSGAPWFTVTPDAPFPYPSESYAASEGGASAVVTGDGIETIAQPAGTYTIVVSARRDGSSEVAADYDLSVVARGEQQVAFNGGVADVVDQESQTWRYFRVSVPAGALGWDLRLKNVVSGAPRMVIRRGDLPDGWQDNPCCSSAVYYRDTWDAGWQWAIGSDITHRTYTPYDPAGTTAATGRVATMGMGGPLEPGEYVIGVGDSYVSQTGDPMSYSLVSRGIGQGLSDDNATDWAIQVTDLDFAGGSATVTDLDAREVAYFRVQVPEGSPSWRVDMRPSAGEAMLAVRLGHLPNTQAGSYDSDTSYHVEGARVQKDGPEFFYKYPPYNADVITGGTYYLAVASEGVDPYSGSYIGTGASSFTLESVGEAPVAQAETPLGPDAPLSWPAQAIDYGEQRLYRFTVPEGITSMQVRLDNVTGGPQAHLSLSPVMVPSPTQHYTAAEGGSTVLTSGPDILNVVAPQGEYTVLVVANRDPGTYQPAPASYDLNVVAQGDATLPFNDGVVAVTEQEPGTWRYFRVTVPPEAAGWDLRLENVASGRPRLAIRRDELPADFSTYPSGTYALYRRDHWDTDWRWAPGSDLTGRVYPPYEVGVYPPDENGQRVSMGLGRPLSPGSYIVGVSDTWTSTSYPAMSYELVSRGIGQGDAPDGAPWSLQVAPLAFDGGAAVVSDLPAREIAYYAVEVPAGARSWGVRLTATAGEAMMAVREGGLPNAAASTNTTSTSTAYYEGTRRQKAGDEYFYSYPKSGEVAIAGGTYYVAVASEGVDPYSTSYIGTGASSFRVESVGEAPELGGSDRVLSATQPVRWDGQALSYGDERVYRLRVPDDVPSFEVRLENTVGRPTFSAAVYPFFEAGIPTPYASAYRPSEGGGSNQGQGDLADEIVGRHGDVVIVVHAERTSTGYDEADASFDLVVAATGVPTLAFDGGSVSDALEDAETRYYVVDVPQNCDAVPSPGWVLDLDVQAGAATVRARKGSLPGAPSGTSTLTSSARQTVLAPPFFSPGTWYVEVQADGLTEYTLTSRPIAPLRQWAMPADGDTAVAAGLTYPTFGDTGVQPDGSATVNPSTGGPGVDLGQDRYHFYRISVPAGNAGFLRTQLEAISGNPQLFVRRGGAPTRSHGTSGSYGTLYDWSDTQSAGTSYGHWAQANTRYGAELEPGDYWVAVAADGSNVRYRLRLAVGRVDDLAQDGGAIAGHALAAGDMRFYKVLTANTSTSDADSAPLDWNLSLVQQQGDVIVFLRERSLPGSSTSVPSTSYPQNTIRDWEDDRNLYPFGSTLPRFVDDQGTTTFPLGLVAPGTTYYLGVYAKTDAVYDLASSVSAERQHLDGVLAFAGGSASGTLAPGEERLYRVDVPEDAARWISESVGGAGLVYRLSLDTLPPDSGADWSTSSTSNRTLDTGLYSNSSYAYNHPWRPGRSYYLRVTNTDAGSQTFGFTLDGRDRSDDSDADGLPDWWEYDSFGSLYPSDTDDYDSDGLDNAGELAAGTDPNDRDTDDDLLSDGLEVMIGADPLAGDSDFDDVCDGEDSAPTDPNESGRVIRLVMGEYHEGWYGHAFGTNEHLTRLVAVFERTSNVAQHWIHITGWGINAPDEVAVYLNGELLGYLPEGSTSGSSIPALFAVDTADLLPVGDNRVELRQKSAGATWGVYDLGLFTFGESFGFDSTAAFDRRHPDGFVMYAPALDDQLLELRGFDVDTDGEVEVLLNGQPLLELPGAGDLAWTPYFQVPMLAEDFATDGNTLRVRPAAGSDGDWQLRLITTRTLLSSFGRYGTSTEDDHGAAGATFLMPRTAELRELKLDATSEDNSTVIVTSTSGDPLAWAGTDSYGPEGFFFSEADAVERVDARYVPDDPAATSRFTLRVRYYGACIDSDGDGHLDCADAFPGDVGEWDDVDGDTLGDNWEQTWFGDLETADDNGSDADGDGVPDADEFLAGTDPVCADLDDDGVDGANAWCATGLDCDDNDPLVGASTDDADCDGVPTALDCDDADPLIGAAAGDADCDGIPAELDCDDNDANVTTTTEGDADCDGVPTAEDCDDTDPTAIAVALDGDCDKVPTAIDCDDSDAGVTTSTVDDADCDGVPTAIDCDDTDPTVTASNVNDADCDGVPTAIDCDDGSAAVTATNVADADCDGVPTGDDCDDTDPAVTTLTTGDLDCDGIPSAIDCDDTDPSHRTTNVNDTDCDGVSTPIDCDDADPEETRSNLFDADCDDVPTDLDCDDHDPTETRSRADDGDCDGVAKGDDCDDTDPSVTTTAATDGDCDGVPTATDCDDADPLITTTNADDADCDGVPAAIDCDDNDAEVTGSTASDADCDGVPTATDCDDADAEVTASTANDADCDGVPTATDCDDADPAETGVCAECVDVDEDGHFARGPACGLGDDCDDEDEASTWLAIDADCDDVLGEDDCDDEDEALGAIADDTDCDGVPALVDCDDEDPDETGTCDTRCVDLDDDGHAAIDPYCPEGDDCDDGDGASTLLGDDADCDGLVTAEDCDDTDPTSTAVAEDQDCDGFPDAVDVCPMAADPYQRDGDADGFGDVCDVCPTEPDADQADADGDGIGDACEDADGDGVFDAVDDCPDDADPYQLDLDHDGIGDACDPEVGTQGESTGCAGTGGGSALTLLLALMALWLLRRRGARAAVAAALAGLLGLGGCGDGKKPRTIGSSCAGAGDCQTGLCAGGYCLDPESDDDGDTLINRIELDDLGTDPLSPDTDGDGVRDDAELADLQNVDEDGDGKPDAIESAIDDSDGDCIPDQYDAEDGVDNSDLSPLFDVVCRTAGVCGEDVGLLSVSCDADTPVCDYAAVAGYEATEVSCDGLDNDCDGLTDEELPPGACGPTLTGLTITPGAVAVWLGDTRGLLADARYDDGSSADATGTVTWSVDDAGVATVDEAGQLTAVAAGVTTVTATRGDAQATARVTVYGECVAGREKLTSDCEGVSGGLVGHYRLDGDGFDSSGLFAHGEVFGAAPVADRFGRTEAAMRFCGAGDRVEVSKSGHPIGDVLATYTFWVKPELAAAAGAVLSAGGDADTERSAVLLSGERACLGYVGGGSVESDGGCLPANRWSFVAVVKTRTEVAFYFDGRLSATTSAPGGQRIQSRRLLLGLSTLVDGAAREQLCGALDDVRVYDRALSDVEILDLYHVGGWAEVGTVANPGESCAHIRDAGVADGDGGYWLDPDGDGGGDAFRAVCDMTTEGGGWTLAWVYGFTTPGDFTAPGNAVTPRPDWPVEDADAPVSTTPPTDAGTAGAVAWGLWRYLGDELLVTSNINDHLVCTPEGGSVARGVGGPVACRVVAEVAPACDGVAPDGLGWGPHGPSLAGPDLYYYWDGSTTANWPTHDPCGTNQANLVTGVTDPGGALWLRHAAP